MADFQKYRKQTPRRSPSPRIQRRQRSPEGYSRGIRSDRNNRSPGPHTPPEDRYESKRRISSNSRDKYVHSRSGSKSRSRSPIRHQQEYEPGRVPENTVHCFACGKSGHWKKECPKQYRRNETGYSSNRGKFNNKSYGTEDYNGRDRMGSGYERQKYRDNREPSNRPSNRYDERNWRENDRRNNMREKPADCNENKTTKLNRHDSGKTPQYNAHDETRAAILAMMESMSSMPTNACGTKQDKCSEAELSKENLDENGNIRDRSSAKPFDQNQNLLLVRKIVDNLIHEVLLSVLAPIIAESKEVPRKRSKPNLIPDSPKLENYSQNDCETGNTSEDAQKIVRMTPPASPENENNTSKSLTSPVTSTRDPRKRKSDTGLKSMVEKEDTCIKRQSNTRKPLIEQLLSHGVPEETFAEVDGLQKMRLTFSGRVHVVKNKPMDKCCQIADIMVDCCLRSFHDYPELATQYANARKQHMIDSISSGYYPEDKVSEDDMSTIPPLLEFRRSLHKRFYDRIGKSAKLPFKFSELVDLTMYYFNHVASCKSWRQHGTQS